MRIILPCCISCNKGIRDGIYDSTFYPNLIIMLSAFVVLAIIVMILSFLNNRFHRNRQMRSAAGSTLSPVPLNTAGMVLGIGLGGFIDGIVLHQILQWHEMLSAKVPATNYIGKSVNMFWDGIFHFFCLMVVICGLILLWRSVINTGALKSGRVLIGGMIAGWGIFNLVEGIIDHQLLELHNVVEYASNHDPANYIFLGISVCMLLIGSFMARSVRVGH